MGIPTVTQIQFNDIAKLLNGQPRRALDWDTPEKAMAKELKKSIN